MFSMNSEEISWPSSLTWIVTDTFITSGIAASKEDIEMIWKSQWDNNNENEGINNSLSIPVSVPAFLQYTSGSSSGKIK